MDGQTDAKGYYIIRPFFKWVYKKQEGGIYHSIRIIGCITETILDYYILAVKKRNETGFRHDFHQTFVSVKVTALHCARLIQLPHPLKFASPERQMAILCCDNSLFKRSRNDKSNKTCHRDRIACLTAPCPSHKKL